MGNWYLSSEFTENACVSYLSSSVTAASDSSHLKEEGFIWTHGLRGDRPLDQRRLVEFIVMGHNAGAASNAILMNQQAENSDRNDHSLQ